MSYNSPLGRDKKLGAADDNSEDDGDDESEDPLTVASRVMDTCLASHEFEWLTPSAPPTAPSPAMNPLEINTDTTTTNNGMSSPAMMTSHLEQQKTKRCNVHRPRRPKDREYLSSASCQMSPTPCYEGHVCRHRMSPMRSSWCCPSPPPPMPFCMHHGGGSLTGMELVPYGQECCAEESCFSCHCFTAGHPHVRHCSPCHYYGASHYAEFSPSSPQHTFKNSGPRVSHRREFSPSSSPLRRPYFANDVQPMVVTNPHGISSCEELCKPPAHAGDTTSLQKIRQLESDKKNLLLQVSVLNDQIEAQADKIRELENNLEDKREQLRLAEQNLHQEMMTRSAIENSKLEMMTEISSLRLRLTASERDRKSSDEKYRKIEHDLLSLQERLAVGEDRSLFRMKISRNGTVMSTSERQAEMDKLHAALESVINANEEKDKKIEELRLALLKCRKLQDYVLSGHGHQRKVSDVSINNMQFDTEISTDGIPPSSPGNDSIKSQSQMKFHGKPPTGQRTPFSIQSSSSRAAECQAKESLLSVGSQTALSSDNRSIQSMQKSSSMENIRHSSSNIPLQKSVYGTIPRQSGSQALERLEEQLQNFESSASVSSSKVQFNIPSPPARALIKTQPRSRAETGKDATRNSRNKSSGVSFGKGFFKLRSGKRSSSAPELAPFDESVTIPIEEREVSSACPTPQPTMQPFFIKPEKERNRGLLRFLTKWKRSGSQNIEKIEGDFRRGGMRATAGPRLGWSRDVSIDPDIQFSHWGNDVIAEWLHKLGLSMYMGECRRWKCNGEQLLNASSSEIEKELNIKNPMHKKKITLSILRYKSDDLPASVNEMDYQWVVRWLDDIGLPQYKDSFSDARVDGRVLHYLTVDDLLHLKVTNKLHHISIKRGIQALRERNFDPHCLIRRSVPNEDKNYTPEYVSLWTNHRVMEWLRTVDLSEYAPNLRGSGVHGALIVYEVKFNTDLFATLLNIPPAKTLLRRHLTTHFKSVVGSEFIQAKRDVETDQLYIPLTPNVKIKGIRKPQFALKKRKSKGETDNEEFVCPMDIPVGATIPHVNGERLIVRRNSDPTIHETKSLTEKDEKSNTEVETVSKEITSLTDILQKETVLKHAPTTNV